MGDRLWPVRRWLADRIIGDHAYSKNLAYPEAATFVADLLSAPYRTSNYAHDMGFRVVPRDPGETA
jgi:hypothetical protein